MSVFLSTEHKSGHSTRSPADVLTAWGFSPVPLTCLQGSFEGTWGLGVVRRLSLYADRVCPCSRSPSPAPTAGCRSCRILKDGQVQDVRAQSGHLSSMACLLRATGSPSFCQGPHLHPFKGVCKQKDACLSWALSGVVSGLSKSSPLHTWAGRRSGCRRRGGHTADIQIAGGVFILESQTASLSEPVVKGGITVGSALAQSHKLEAPLPPKTRPMPIPPSPPQPPLPILIFLPHPSSLCSAALSLVALPLKPPLQTHRVLTDLFSVSHFDGIFFLELRFHHIISA